ncbi:deoxyribose-phosphate aldolase [Selenomonas sp.]|uniref:deoxyribose-phosphate aldolase n=1 Tax=Selenomonas sp. TaxID=2053611 RepID=UPI002A74BA18|nr:deoxyribose-phosphate aldolase [Selenomonas sp.]MDY3296598.1 deoxyribose-phosphate aldolase [Selenomonas sp.]
MKAKDILSHVDHTLLKQTATWQDIVRVCDEAVAYHTATIMVPSCYVRRIHEAYGAKLKVATVVGFPNGNANTAAKLAETAQALADGAEEIDMVVNVGWLKGGEMQAVTDEIRALKSLCGNRVLKVIVETCFLTEAEKIAACKCVTNGGADYIKTSTGFGTAGAKIEDIELFKQHIGPGVKMKAAGGIHTREEMEAFLAAGCDRLGASAAVKVLKDEFEKEEA